jgi:hypothetical protein
VCKRGVHKENRAGEHVQGQTNRSNRSGLIQSAMERRWRDESKLTNSHIQNAAQQEFRQTGKVIVDESAKSELVSLGGKPYLRVIEENGTPLGAHKADDEEKSYRS